MPGDVTVAVRHSTVNYKDGLALTGKAPILRKFPMTPGIDFAGEVLGLGERGVQARRTGRAERVWGWRGA